MTDRTFPDDFLWGVATSSFQIEGAADVDGKGESIWDRFCEQPGAVKDGTDGKVACDHYNRYPSDVQMMADLGMQAYRDRAEALPPTLHRAPTPLRTKRLAPR